MIRGGRLTASLTVALVLFTLSPRLPADSDHDRARKALEPGEILPLRTIIARLERDYPGQIRVGKSVAPGTRVDGRGFLSIRRLTPSHPWSCSIHPTLPQQASVSPSRTRTSITVRQ